MIEELSNEMRQFIKDIKQNITDTKTSEYVLRRSEKLFNIILKEVENIVKYKEDEINQLIKKQNIQEDRIKDMESKIKEIIQDIYDEDGDFEIVCPYCNYKFSADICEDEREIVCPECENIIELDWSEGQEDNDDKSL